ncbi:MAG: hypothetical protein EOS54_12400 [Mesorhizobium sp.]|uniref:hypothetical protein n=1 Tax=unclassified Mesorhizobium TaxID=325217 RepID=UPI000F756BCB|nr:MULTISPECIES: hypothetical protein [unclassified Mesorhizobium]AZO47231.1 hypothetical protein EJ073_04850 [Mesorhizobium sp. M4B.F.Ca.ET.058.02.1.1]RWC53513.1 MAG: hypothetical protein EOS54_12400 [Mesorhizobium sp.]RWD13968.1 MAG: hypothetical protein EOS74_18430 [Mesorhizobium sp.]RWD55681.1 MAG: hypothetical protein EOS75_17155 [Mesorhizobium sp.]TIW13891.1 MAG: hypothetical protein E5V66_01915 [Mesorhizobium sp.]
MTIPDLDAWRALCPFIIWRDRTGREVLANRLHVPILQRYRGVASVADPTEQVAWVERELLWHGDANAPWSATVGATASLARVNRMLAQWGLPALPKPPRPGASPRGARADSAQPWAAHFRQKAAS